MIFGKTAGALILGAVILAGAGCNAVTSTPPVEVSFRLQDSAQIGQSGAPKSDIYLVVKGLTGADSTMDVQMGTGEGCYVSDPAYFASKGDSLAEAHCIYAAGYEYYFSAHLNSTGDIEVLRREIGVERAPESVYTFDLEAGVTAVGGK